MKVSDRWLRDYVDHDLTVDELAERLTMLGLEVEDVERQGGSLEGVVVGRVEAVRAHPNADRLVLCDVQLQEDTDPVQIVCGAPNVAAGQKVPVATVGTTLRLSDGENGKQTVTIKETSIRDEASSGMICSEDELGLSENHEGIMVLGDDASLGQPFEQYLAGHGLHAADAVLDIDITPNRPDATSHIGVARDVAAWTGNDLTLPPVDLPEEGREAADRISIRLEDAEACPRYVGIVIDDVEVGPSPLWLRRRLTAIGLRPRNNVVDATNYVMHECGQPLHAFDLDELAGNEIVVQTTDQETSFVTLDDEERTVPAGALFICDAERPVALAGIMGGANSEVSDSTTSILLESAYFDPATIRRTASALGLSTDSSYRFERGIDTDGQLWAAARAAQLIAEIAGGSVVPGYVEAYPALLSQPTIRLRPERVNDLLGTDLSVDEITGLLRALQFEVKADGDALDCTVPTFRPDVTREVDLIEEVARLHGYDAIPVPGVATIPADVPETLPSQEIRGELRSLLQGLGFREIYTNSMRSKDEADRFNAPELQAGASAGPIAQTLKPISQEMAALRPSLLPGLLHVMQHNRNHGQQVLRFYETGHVFRKTDRPDTTIPGYAEHESLIIGLSGSRAPHHWSGKPENVDFFDLKGVVGSLCDHLNVPAEFRPTDRTHSLTTYQVEILSGDTPLGTLSRLSLETAEEFDLDVAPVFFAELDWSSLTALASEQLEKTYRPISRHPVVERDLAVLLDEDQPVGPVADAIRQTESPILREVEVFDLYAGKGVPEDQKSIAFSLRFGADRTLTDEEVDKAMNAILNMLRADFSAELRQ